MPLESLIKHWKIRALQSVWRSLSSITSVCTKRQGARCKIFKGQIKRKKIAGIVSCSLAYSRGFSLTGLPRSDVIHADE